MSRHFHINAGRARAFVRAPLALLALLAMLPLGVLAMAWEEEGCGPPPLQPVTGPKGQGHPADYRDGGLPVQIIDRGHFGPLSESLSKPKFEEGPRGGGFGGDLTFTLDHIPNHHRALLTMLRLGERDKTDQPRHLRLSIECYLVRATRFRPNDFVVRMIYAKYLHAKNRDVDAAAQLDFVASRSEDNPLTRFNLGLIYAEIKDYDKALAHAHAAYAGGIVNPALRRALEKAGKWADDTGAQAPAPQGEPAPAPASVSTTPAIQ